MALVLTACAGCSDPPRQPDASAPEESSLQILEPPGTDIGLAPGAATLLRVSLRGSGELPAAGVKVQFAIFGDPRGSTLSADSAYTSAEGIAQVQLRAGAASCSFQVHVSAPGAPEAVFYVEVSTAGFGAIALQSAYAGSAEGSAAWRVRYLLYEAMACSSLVPPGQPPPLRNRLAQSIEQAISLRALPLDTSHTVLALGLDPQDQLQASGCVEIPPQVLHPAQELQLTVALEDLQPALSGSFLLRTVLQHTPAGLPRPVNDLLSPWDDLADCPLDPAQLLLDCLLDALDPVDPLDCLVEAPGPTAKAIGSERGVLGEGCRGELTSRGTLSLERRLDELMRGQDPALLAALAQIPEQARTLLGRLHLESRLQVLSANPGESRLSLHHRLLSLGFGAGEQPELVYPLALLGLPQREAGPIPGELAGWQLTIAEHGLSLGLGLAGRLAVNERVLGELGQQNAAQLATTLAELVRQPGDTGPAAGCPAIEAVICQATRLEPACLAGSCPAGVQALGSYLDDRFHEGSGAWSVLTWSGAATLHDQDGDLRPEQLGSAAAPGQWTRVRISAGSVIIKPQEASFTGVQEQQE